MTELERRLTQALTALSAQYEREQKRQAELIESLSKQVSRLDERAARLAGDYEQIASDYAGLATDYKTLVKLCGIRSGGSHLR